MSFLYENGMWMIGTDAVTALAIAMCFLMMGYVLRRKIPFLDTCCLPAAVVGGLLFSMITLVLHNANLAEVSLDTTFQGPAMVAFFTCIGLGGDFKILKKGGKLLLVYWLFIAIIVLVQSLIPIAVSQITHFDPVYAVLAGTTTMVGGHGNGGSFGTTAEQFGYAAGNTVGLACATFGMIGGALTGGPFARRMIEKYQLEPNNEDVDFAREQAENCRKEGPLSLEVVLKHVTFLVIVMAIGTVLAKYATNAISNLLGGSMTITLPDYVGGMVLAIILRNVDEKFHFVNLNHSLVERMNDIMISVYLALAMCSMKLWQLASLFIPLLLILFLQVLFDLVYTRFMVFPTLKKVGGSAYDAAVMCSGFLGHTLGATPNAISNMSTVTEKYGPSRTAMLIVPPTGSFLADVVSIPTIVIFFNIALNLAGVTTS